MAILPVTIQTTDDVWTRAGLTITIPPGTIGEVEVSLVATDYGSNFIGWKIRCVVVRFLNDSPIIKTKFEIPSSHMFASRLVIDSDNLIHVEVQGRVGSNIDWLITVLSENLFVMSGSAPLQAGPSTLLNGLVAYWKLDETSGTRYDSII